MKDCFLGIDTAQVNQGVSIITDDLKVEFTENTKVNMPKEFQHKSVPDIIKNNYQVNRVRDILKGFDKPKFAVLEGPLYSGTSITQVSIGSIHGAMQQLMFDLKVNFAVVTPLSIQYFVHGTAKNISKRDTMNKMKQLFNLKKIRDSNIADSLGMALLACKFWQFITLDVALEHHEKEIISSARKYQGEPKGLIYKRDIKVFIFDDSGVKNKDVLISRLV